VAHSLGEFSAKACGGGGENHHGARVKSILNFQFSIYHMPSDSSTRIILHLDMDAFYAAIEQLDHPEYRGKPVVVGADPKGGTGRGVVSTCSYEARKFGIHSAMPISQAYRRCPNAIYVFPRFERYAEISRQIMAIQREFSPQLLQISVDEAFIDITQTANFHGGAQALAEKLKARIKNETGLTASIGVAPNMFIAKVASDLQKPDGLTICAAGQEKTFLAPLPVKKLWGVGPKTEAQLQTMGFSTIGQMAQRSQKFVAERLGKWGAHLWELANGIDDRPVEDWGPRKSISQEHTYDQDVADMKIVEQTIWRIAEGLSADMRRTDLKGQVLTLKIRLEGFETFTRQRKLAEYTHDAETMRTAALEIFRKFDRKGKKVRLIGIGMSHLNNTGGEQLSLFQTTEQLRRDKVSNLLDTVRAKHGEEAATRASLLALIGLLIFNLLLAGCASKTKIQPLQEMEVKPVVEMRHGNAVSAWIDRTSAISQASALPPAGEDCAMIYDPVQHRIILFGGKDDENRNLNEVWALDLTQNVWQKIAMEGEWPPASEDHAVIYDPLGHRMILHGGEDGFTTNKLWALDLKTQRWRNLTDSTTPAREDHTAIFDSFNNRMVIFGGQNNNSQTAAVNLYDLWAFDLDPNSPRFEQWQDLTVEDNHPPGRSDHVAVYDEKKNRLVIYGGWDKDLKEPFGDTWAFYFPLRRYAPGKWKQLKTHDSHPPKRRHAAGVYDASRNWFIVFGGFGEEGYLNDVWAFDLNADAWLNITPGPQPRLDQQAIFDPRSNHLIIYGGDARLKSKFHDLWELQIQPNLPLDLMLKEAGAQPKTENKRQ
jgi:nucleotidyltransferase/DNA polymerase involved in DNA repair